MTLIITMRWNGPKASTVSVDFRRFFPMMTDMNRFADLDLAAAPSGIRALLWDLDPHLISVDQDTDSIIPRIMITDDPDLLRWLRQRIGDASIREWILARRGGDIGDFDLFPWTVLLDIPEDAVDWHYNHGMVC